MDSGPQDELAVIRRLCKEYALGQLGFADLARLCAAEGWTDCCGRVLTAHAIATLLRNEALIGNFVWGQHGRQRRIVDQLLCRATGTVPRIIDDATWRRVQERLARERDIKDSEVLREELRRALACTPLLVSRDLIAVGCAHARTYSNRFGSWSAAVREAGGDPAALADAVSQRARDRKEHIRAFGWALADALRAQRLTAAYDGRRNLLCLWGVMIQLRLLWKAGEGKADPRWHIRDEAPGPGVSWVLLVRMSEPFRALDYFVVTDAELATRMPPWLALETGPDLERFRCRTPSTLVKKLRTLGSGSHKAVAATSGPACEDVIGR
jgi:hypothetical protein